MRHNEEAARSRSALRDLYTRVSTERGLEQEFTRSLTDFAKLVEPFDAHGVCFASVTQAFKPPIAMFASTSVDVLRHERAFAIGR